MPTFIYTNKPTSKNEENYEKKRQDITLRGTLRFPNMHLRQYQKKTHQNLTTHMTPLEDGDSGHAKNRKPLIYRDNPVFQDMMDALDAIYLGQ